MKDTVSIIVPIYNTEKYLSRCIDSLIYQTYKDVEILLIDDGSKDSSGGICERYLKDKRVRVFHNENHGVSFTRNYGINQASGKYIMFVDSDDICDKDMVEKLHTAITESGAEIALCGLKTFTDNKVNLKCIYEPTATLDIKQYIETVLLKIKIGQLCGAPYCKIYSAELIKSNNLSFDIGITYAEDFNFNMEYLKYCNKISIIEDQLYFYRDNVANSLTSRNYRSFSKESYFNQRMLAYQKFESVYTKYGLLVTHRDEVNSLLREFIISSIKMACKFASDHSQVVGFIDEIVNNNFIRERLIYSHTGTLDKIRVTLIKNKKSHLLFKLESFRYKVGVALGKCKIE